MPAPRASREEVLAWMDETGLGPGPASKHFGIPKNTIKSWRRRGRERARRGAAPDLPDPGELPETARAKVRAALDNVAGYLIAPSSRRDPRGLQAAASALKHIIEVAADWIALEEELDDRGGSSGGHRGPEPAAVLRALELDPGDRDSDAA